MDHSSRQQEQQPSRFFASLELVNRAIQWLTNLVQLTEEEQKDAGIYYPGDQPPS